MKRRDAFSALVDMAREKGSELAHKAGKAFNQKVARPLGEKIVAKASQKAMDKGLVDEAVDMDALMKQLSEMRANGELSVEEFMRRKDEIIEKVRRKKQA